MNTEKLSRGELQIREVLILDGRVDGQPFVIKGSYWGSGYDERLRTDLDVSNLPDGEYLVTFVPVGEEQGMDSFEKLTFYKRVENTWD